MGALSTFLQKEGEKTHWEKLREAQPKSLTPKTFTGLTTGAGTVAGVLAGHAVGKRLNPSTSPLTQTIFTLGGGVVGGRAGHRLGQKLDKKFGFSKENNPNPKGNDRDDDGKTNEPKPFKSAAATPYIVKSESKLRHIWDVLSGTRAKQAKEMAERAALSAPRVTTQNPGRRAAQEAARAAYNAPYEALHSAEREATTRGRRLAAGALTAAGLTSAGLTARSLSKRRKAQSDEGKKEASALPAYSQLFDLVVAGEFGKEASAELRTICLGIDAKLDSLTVTNDKIAAMPEEPPQDSRQRRLAELLRKREHSGTATGSASPSPPRGA